MKEIVLIVGMTVALVFLFTKHVSFMSLRERITDKFVQYEERGKKNYIIIFLHTFFTCDYCCGFWMGIVSFLSLKYCEPLNYLFTGGIVSYLIFNKE